MQTTSTIFEVELKKLIDEDVEKLKDEIALGQAVTDFAKYREYVGRIRAYRDVLDLFGEVTTKLSER